MPLYDLGCTVCDCTIEDISISVNEYEKKKCPKCAHQMKSITFTSTKFIGKGHGWTPRMTGPERFRPREKVIGEAKHEWKKAEVEKKHCEQRERERVKHYDFSSM